MSRKDKFKSIVGNRIFSVTFTKKDGKIRKMLARTGVHLGKKRGKATSADHDNLVTVYDLEKGAYRTINLDAVTEVKQGEFHWSRT